MINFNFIQFGREINGDASDNVDVKHMEISGKFRVTSSRQRAIALRTAKALVKIKITLRFVDDRERATGNKRSVGVVAISAVVRITLS